MRLAPWLMVSIAITFLFTGNEQNILVRIQHNWSGAIIVLVVGFIYQSRFGLTRKSVGQQIRLMSNKKRTTLRVLGVVTFLLGILIELFLYFLPNIILIPLIVICAMVAPTCLYYSYYSKGSSVAIDKKGHFH